MGIQAKQEQLNEGLREQAQEVQGPRPSNCSHKHWTTVAIRSMQIQFVGIQAKQEQSNEGLREQAQEV